MANYDGLGPKYWCVLLAKNGDLSEGPVSLPVPGADQTVPSPPATGTMEAKVNNGPPGPEQKIASQKPPFPPETHSHRGQVHREERAEYPRQVQPVGHGFACWGNTIVIEKK